ncbi:hypothetical protein GCM10028857_11610 [Salinarchaeum chitinilyticum]
MIHESIDVVPAAARILAMAIGSASVAAAASLAYRWYSGGSIPEGVPILLGVSIVATALNTTATLQKSLVADELVGGSAAGYTLAAFAVGTIAADAGRRAGEHLAGDLPSVESVRTMESDVGSLVRAAGRVIRVRVPETIEDIDGYEPVPKEVKADLAGTTFLFPRRMTVGELRERLVERLKRDYEVGHVDVELAEDGSVEYLALGRRLAGVGQTLAPGTVAVAIRADPAFTATPGDRVQIWRPPESAQAVSAEMPEEKLEEADDESVHDSGVANGADAPASEPTQVTTGELRATVGEVVTIAVDESDADLLDDDVRYRLVTLPASVQTEREFASLLRSADETMGSITVEAGSDLDGSSVESIDLTVVALQSNGDVSAIPPGDRVLDAGETVYVVGRPDGIRRLETRGKAGDGDPATGESGGSDGPEGAGQSDGTRATAASPDRDD